MRSTSAHPGQARAAGRVLFRSEGRRNQANLSKGKQFGDATHVQLLRLDSLVASLVSYRLGRNDTQLRCRRGWMTSKPEGMTQGELT